MENVALSHLSPHFVVGIDDVFLIVGLALIASSFFLYPRGNSNTGNPRLSDAWARIIAAIIGATIGGIFLILSELITPYEPDPFQPTQVVGGATPDVPTLPLLTKGAPVPPSTALPQSIQPTEKSPPQVGVKVAAPTSPETTDPVKPTTVPEPTESPEPTDTAISIPTPTSEPRQAPILYLVMVLPAQPPTSTPPPSTPTDALIATPTRTPSSTVTLTSTPSHTDTATATETVTPTAIPTPSCHDGGLCGGSLVVHAFYDFRCNGGFNAGVDRDIDASITLAYSDRSEVVEGRTGSNGRASFTVNLPVGTTVTVSIEWPQIANGRLVSCPGSPTSRELTPSDFHGENAPYNPVYFRARLADEVSSP